jgi:hypothetical protein
MSNKRVSRVDLFVAPMAAAIGLICLTLTAQAQERQRDMDWSGNIYKLSRVEPGTFLRVRTTQPIISDRAEGRVFTGVVAEDVWDDYRRLAVPAIPRGSPVELIVRSARDGDLILDLESVVAHGQRYTMSAAPERIETGEGSRHPDTATFAGGGAILGSIIGAIAGGGKGAAIGAAAGAATGLGVALNGRSVRVPSGSLLTFRLEKPLVIGAPDDGFSRDGRHYHPYPRQTPPRDR